MADMIFEIMALVPDIDSNPQGIGCNQCTLLEPIVDTTPQVGGYNCNNCRNIDRLDALCQQMTTSDVVSSEPLSCRVVTSLRYNCISHLVSSPCHHYTW